MNVGDYCYIKGISRDYGIGKIKQLNSGYSSRGGELIDIQFKHSKHSVPKIDVVSSPNIIDLIEVGDYVNGCPVLHKENNELVCGLLLRYKEENIQNVVTKEQFSQIEYKVESEVN